MPLYKYYRIRIKILCEAFQTHYKIKSIKMIIKTPVLLLVILLALDSSYSKPQQQLDWIIHEQSGDGAIAMDIPDERLSNNDGLDNFLKTPRLNVNKAFVARCYRDDFPTVDVNLYYEALCPACMNFVSNELYPAYHNLGKYINLKLLPYGNTETWDKTDSEGKAKTYLLIF